MTRVPGPPVRDGETIIIIINQPDATVRQPAVYHKNILLKIQKREQTEGRRTTKRKF